MVGWSTQGGRKLPVQESQVPHWCTQRGLVEHGIAIREEQPISSVCLMIQTISATYLEFKDTTMCMEQSIKTHGAPLSAVQDHNVHLHCVPYFNKGGSHNDPS